MLDLRAGVLDQGRRRGIRLSWTVPGRLAGSRQVHAGLRLSDTEPMQSRWKPQTLVHDEVTMTTPRWNTRDTGSDLYLIECGNVVVGSVARLRPAEAWRVEILWS